MNQLDEALVRIEAKIDNLNAIVNSIEETERKIFQLEQLTNSHNDRLNKLSVKVQEARKTNKSAILIGSAILSIITSYLIYGLK